MKISGKRVSGRSKASLCCAAAAALTLVSGAALAADKPANPAPARWTTEQACAWYNDQPWRVGANFIPSTAVNQLEMWQKETFDPQTIDRELGFASKVGMNAMRVFLHNLAWQADAEGFKDRIRQYLDIADRHHIATMFVLFDDCWNDNPAIGRQPAPVPGVHNSGWLQSPGVRSVNDPATWPPLEKYVTDILTTFGQDKRVFLWDLYNEPGNSRQGDKSLGLLKAAFAWARKANPSQPLSAGVWFGNKTLNEFQLANSDIITFHNYGPADHVAKQIAELKKRGRPVLCTEYMKRPESRLESHLPLFKKEKVAAINWGLVSGKTQTIYPWGSPKGAPEPKQWFHDLFRPDGTPFDAKEIKVVRELTKP